MTPHSEIADTLDAIGIGEHLQPRRESLVADWYVELLAALEGQNDDHGGLLPSRLQDRKNDSVDVGFGYRWW